ncbi:TauD/TfdA family dioxygenase [Nonomuraea gerenzanensis]|nr:TauD/TfdA family dioxygenase [Nonomuraea gerenzanensis]UBU13006.1 TauD/TfdA family dioxygenase [Nonomuraea gerenzanensis]
MSEICLSEADRRELAEVASVVVGWSLDGPSIEALRDRAGQSESLRSIGLEVRRRMREDGFALVKNVPCSEDAELVAFLGLIAVPSAPGNGDTLFFDISPSSSRSDDVSGTSAEFPLHTDSTFFSVPHDVLALACVRNSDSGGESIIVRAADVADRVRAIGGADALAALGDQVYPFYLRDPLFGHGIQLVPILVADGDEWCIRYRGDILTKLTERFELDEAHRHALSVLNQVVAEPESCAAQVRLETDDLIIVDNRRALHARTALGPGERRLRRMKGYSLNNSSWRII